MEWLSIAISFQKYTLIATTISNKHKPETAASARRAASSLGMISSLRSAPPISTLRLIPERNNQNLCHRLLESEAAQTKHWLAGPSLPSAFDHRVQLCCARQINSTATTDGDLFHFERRIRHRPPFEPNSLTPLGTREDGLASWRPIVLCPPPVDRNYLDCWVRVPTSKCYPIRCFYRCLQII